MLESINTFNPDVTTTLVLFLQQPKMLEVFGGNGALLEVEHAMSKSASER